MLYSPQIDDLLMNTHPPIENKMRAAALRTDYIIKESLAHVKSGMTDLEIKKKVLEIYESDKHLVPENVSESLGWQPDLCPIIYLNDTFWKSHPRATGSEKLKKGATLSIDFGVTFEYDDGTTCVGDLQRSAYVLNDHENTPSIVVNHLFSVVQEAIQKGKTVTTPGNRGKDVHQRITSLVESYGFDHCDFYGHSISNVAHDQAITIHNGNHGILKQGQIIALEPRITIPNGISLEEMIICKDEPEFLIPPQDDLILIR